MSWLNVLALCVVLSSASCSTDNLSGDIEVEVLVVNGVDPSNGAPSFALNRQTLRGVENLQKLETAFLRVVRGGVLRVDEISNADVVEPIEFRDGQSADLRYYTDDGVVVARDYSGVIMLSALYSAQETALSLDAIGVARDDFFSRGRFEVLFEPEFRASAGEVEVVVRPKLNAFFLPGANQFGLAQRSFIETVPIGANPVVLAHEFGHALFEFLFYDGLAPSSCDANPEQGRLFGEYAIAGFNEGYGDFVAFSRFGITNPLFAFSDRIDISDRGFSSEYVYDDLEDEKVCGGRFYCIGTLFARSLYLAYLALGDDPLDELARSRFASTVNSALQGTRQRVLASGLLPAIEPDPCTAKESIELGRDGQVTGAFLSSFAAGLPATEQIQVCAEFVRQFGAIGFPTTHRGVCGL